jgi:hypothetical protein
MIGDDIGLETLIGGRNDADVDSNIVQPSDSLKA